MRKLNFFKGNSDEINALNKHLNFWVFYEYI